MGCQKMRNADLSLAIFGVERRYIYGCAILPDIG